MATATAPVFQGSATEQELAQRIFEVMTRGYGALYARDAVIRQSISNLAAFIAEREGRTAEALKQQIDAVVRQNPQVFAYEERDGDAIVSTTRSGTPAARRSDVLHTFRNRLYEPEHPLPADDLDNIVTTVRQVIPAPEPVLISAFWRGAPTTAPVEVPTVPVAEAEPVAASPVEAAIVEEVPAPVVATPVPSLPNTAIVLSDGTSVDLAVALDQLLAEHSAAIQAELAAAFSDDPLRRVVSFGDLYYPADALINYGKNDMRRIRDFIVEQGEPLSDATILTDLYRRRPHDADFAIGRFSLDYRLARERDFEFVGMQGANLWSAKGLPAIGGKRLKASDLGQLYSYLVEGYDDAAEQAAADLVQHTLTYFEWEYGVLPFGADLQALLPAPMLAEQRTAVIRVESPQHYSAYLCEVRFATANRGGWVWGLEDFFHEYLVPGVAISLAPTEEPNVFTVTYEEAPAVETKLLHLDEKRNRFVFMPVTYYAAADEALLPSQARYNKLRNLKALPVNDRKKAENVLAHVFETVGEQLGSKEEPLYWIAFDELHLAVNVLRPVSQTYLQHLLASDEVFYADETAAGAWYYKPAPQTPEAGDEEEEDDTILAYDEDDE